MKKSPLSRPERRHSLSAFFLIKKQAGFVWTALSLREGQTEEKALSLTREKFLPLDLWVIFQRSWRSVGGGGGVGVGSVLLCKVQAQNKTRREDRRGGETQGNMSGILSTGYGEQALVWGGPDWRLLPWMIRSFHRGGERIIPKKFLLDYC